MNGQMEMEKSKNKLKNLEDSDNLEELDLDDSVVGDGVIDTDQEARASGQYFISENWFWDIWFMKLFSQAISIKNWVMALSTVLLVTGFITSGEFITLFTIIMGIRGASQFVGSVKKNGNGNSSGGVVDTAKLFQEVIKK